MSDVVQESELVKAAQGHIDSSLARELTTTYHKQAAQRQHDASMAIELHNLPSDEVSNWLRHCDTVQAVHVCSNHMLSSL